MGNRSREKNKCIVTNANVAFKTSCRLSVGMFRQFGELMVSSMRTSLILFRFDWEVTGFMLATSPSSSKNGSRLDSNILCLFYFSAELNPP